MTQTHTVIFHAPELTNEQLDFVRAELPGTLERCDGFFRLRTDGAASPESVARLRSRLNLDVNILPEHFDPSQVRLVITDMDSTLINIECIDEIADFAGMKPQVSQITEATMRGELNFEQSLTRRVRLLAGLTQDILQRVYDERLKPNPGTEALIAWLKSRAIKTALVSGGFTFFTERLQRRLGLDYARANLLEIENGTLTGRVIGTIVGAEAKEQFLLDVCAQLNITPGQAVALGDGANDLKMLRRAGLGVAYRAKPTVQEQADVVLNHGTLEHVRHFFAP